MSNIIAVFRSIRCSNCDTFLSRTFNWELNSTTCSERLKNIEPRKQYQIRETLFDKLDYFGIKYTSQQKLFEILAIFDFELINVQEETFKNTKTTTWIGKHIAIENYQYLQQIWKYEQVSSFNYVLSRYKKEDIVRIVDAMQKMINFYHGKHIEMLGLGCTLPNFPKICLHKSTDVKFYPPIEGDKDLFEKNSRRCFWWSIDHFYTKNGCR